MVCVCVALSLSVVFQGKYDVLFVIWFLPVLLVLQRNYDVIFFLLFICAFTGKNVM